MITRFLPLIVAASLALVGCNATQQLAEETQQARADFVEGARKEIQTAVPTDVQQKWEEIKQKGPEMAAAVTQVEQITRGILEGHGITLPQREWIEQELKKNNPEIDAILQPVMQLVAIEVPSAQQWAQQVIDQQAAGAKTAATEGWVKVREAVDTALAAPTTGNSSP